MEGVAVHLALAEQAAVEAKQGLLQLADGQLQVAGLPLTPRFQQQQILELPQGHLHGALLALGAIGPQFQCGIPQPPLGLGHQGLGPIATVDGNPLAPVFGGLELGLLQQPGDLLLAEVGAALDAHGLLAARGAIGGRHLQQAVGIDVEGNLHLRNTPGGRRDAREAETAQRLVVDGHLALPLEHVDLHRVLIGLRSAEQIALAHRDRSVAGDQHLHHAADRLQPEREGGDVIEHQIAQLAGEDAGLHGGADRHHLVGIDGLTGLERNQGAHQLLHHRHAGGSAHQHHLVDVLGGQV